MKMERHSLGASKALNFHNKKLRRVILHESFFEGGLYIHIEERVFKSSYNTTQQVALIGQ